MSANKFSLSSRGGKIFLLLIIIVAFVANVAFYYNKINAKKSSSAPLRLVEQNIPASTTTESKTEHKPSLQNNNKTSDYNLPVLMYHYIRQIDLGDPDSGQLSVSPVNFDQQMKALVSAGYSTISPDELAQLLENDQPVPNKKFMLTFDDGYADFYPNAYPVLQKYNLRAIVFVITDKIGTNGYLNWQEIKEMRASGHVIIGGHTKTHVDLTYCEPDQIDREIIISKAALEKELREPITVFAYPAGHYDSYVLATAKKAGYQFAFTTEFGSDQQEAHPYTLKRVRIGNEYFPEGMVSFLESLK